MADESELQDNDKDQTDDTGYSPEVEDKLVDDIQRHDSDELLDEENPKHHEAVVVERAWHKRLWNKLASNKKVSIPAAIVVLLVILSAVPFTRYPIFGLFIKDDYTLAVWDSQTNQPVSAATISIAGKTATTDNHGMAHLKVKVGHHTLTITKNYYTTLSSKILVPLRSHSGNTPYTLVATGRQVPVTVTNKINGQPVDDAVVKAAGTEAHTDKTGKVIIVLPANKSTLAATISASGYNDASATIQVTTQAVKANDFQVTPAGKVYFLSKLSGTIDVVKTNLDGTDRQTVLAGTGNESDTGTVLLASRDWKYLALLSIRDTSGNPQINLIDTSNDQVTNIDKGDASFSAVGWAEHYFIYSIDRNNIPVGQANQQGIKSYNADTNQLNQLDSTQVFQDNSGQGYQNLGNVYASDNLVTYSMTWTLEGSSTGNKQNTIMTVQPDGQNKKTVITFDPIAVPYIQSTAYKPNEIYFDVYSNGSNVYYDLDNGVIKGDPSLTSDQFYQVYNTYLESPSSNQTFWSEPRDGKNTLFVGDENGDNGKQIATLSDYDTYGWYTDNYLLVSKDSDELYIMPVAGGTPIQISDYHKPAQNFSGYGGGYGGE